MNIVDIIIKKRNNQELSKEEIYYVINGYVNEEIKDYQMSSLLMAIYFNSMSDQELFDFTKAIIDSGEVIDLSSIDKLCVDKHSTGGVGDKVSLIIGPLLASFNLGVAKLSGRGLGHTGGTVDKLESIPGFHVEISDDKFIKQVKDIGLAIVGQSKNLVPADKKLYALRDVTGTVDSIPLIASSIMSKKIASGASIIVLDVKYGSGAFMKTKEEAIKLGQCLVKIGKAFNKKTIALITSMNQPLGKNVGNALEVKEAIDVLKGEGPSDITELCYELVEEVLLLTGNYTKEEARLLINMHIQDGTAYKKFVEFTKAQGATSLELDISELTQQVFVKEEGYITSFDSELVGKGTMLLGAGRVTKEDTIDYDVGLEVHKKIGDYVKEGDLLYTLYINHNSNVDSCIDLLQKSYTVGNEQLNIKMIEEIVR
ncbi:MAG: thymidine phosphorylase [Mycoplasmatales bacterium]